MYYYDEQGKKISVDASNLKEGFRFGNGEKSGCKFNIFNILIILLVLAILCGLGYGYYCYSCNNKKNKE